MDNQLTVGIVGAGGFAAFAAKSFLKVEGIRIKALTDIDINIAQSLSAEIGSHYYPEYAELLQDEEIDLIYIATPPWLHYEQSRQALLAGKHVICEKPAALATHDAEEIATLAKSKNLLYTVNLMQRYNPLYAIVKKIIDEKWFGDFVHGFFENYASDEKLVPEHWFWDLEKSGGIFIEHGVHFFDMFDGWLGAGQLAHSMEIVRDKVKGLVIDRVQAVVLYQNGPVNFYHGFNQPKVLDRQEIRLQFDRGDITLYEWIPVKIRMHGLLTSEQVIKIKNIFPDSTIEIHSDPSSHEYKAKGKFKEITYDVLATVIDGDIADKMERYEQLVVSMIQDQWTWIRDNSHQRVIDGKNAVESLRMAEEATLKATRYD